MILNIASLSWDNCKWGGEGDTREVDKGNAIANDEGHISEIIQNQYYYNLLNMLYYLSTYFTTVKLQPVAI